MAFNPFVGWTEAELLAERRKVQQEMIDGGALTSGGAGGTSFSRAPQYSAQTRLNWIQQSLNVINPTTYPLADMMPTAQMPTFFQSIPSPYGRTSI
jgi:hypothetical protein